jgi:hypothetical protein
MSTDNGFKVVRPGDIGEVENTEWAMENYITRVGLNAIVGPEKVGKGFWNVRTLAKLTRGTLLGCYYGIPIVVVIVAYEDRAVEWKKRMQAAGANPNMWFLLERKDGSILKFDRHLQGMLDTLQREEAVFIYFDQIYDHLNLKDSNDTSQKREAVLPLAHALNERGICGLANDHPNKKKGVSFRERFTGSAALYAVSRSAQFVADHPFDPDRRIVVPAPNNYGPISPSMEFKIVGKHIHRSDGKIVRSARAVVVEWESSMGLEDLDAMVGAGPRKIRQTELQMLITSLFVDGKARGSEVMKVCHEAGHSKPSIRRAAKRMGITGYADWVLPLAREHDRHARRG